MTLVLLLGATGRVGNLALIQLLQRQIRVKVIVRSPSKLLPDQISNPLLNVVTKDLTTMTPQEYKVELEGVDAVVSCLGHVMGMHGILFEDLLVYQSANRVVQAIQEMSPPKPIKFIHLSTAGAWHPDGRDAATRGWLERSLLAALYVVVPMRDSQSTVDYLHQECRNLSHVEWVALRPGNFQEGEVGEYVLRPTSSIFDSDNNTNMENIAHCMARLVEDNELWQLWKGDFPIIVNRV